MKKHVCWSLKNVIKMIRIIMAIMRFFIAFKFF
jgi:hypothetical protein